MKDYFAKSLMHESESMTALRYAYEAQVKSAKVGFDFDSIETVMGKVEEEISETREAFEERDSDKEHFVEEIGDCLFVIVNLCRWAEIDPEEVLKANVHKYLKRSAYVEDKLIDESKEWKDVDISWIYAAWKEAKKSGL